MFKKSRITTAALLALGGTVLVTGVQAQQGASNDQRVEVTGSRLKRAQTEGALPVTVIDRAAIEASGQVSVAELMRDSTFSSFGNFKPQSGSSAQALADIDLRGLGSNRTLVLVDGRRAPKAPFVGSASDVNAIPLAGRMAAVVDQQNAGDPAYTPMAPRIGTASPSPAYQAALDLVFQGLAQPSGYTEPLLHAWRLRVKAG